MSYAKKAIIAILVLVTVFAAACSGGTGKYKDGSYTGTGEGKYGPIKVEVSVEKGKIKDVKVLEHSETPGLSDPILQKIPAEIIKKQSTEVAAISGATVTSDAIKQAVTDALKNAQ